MNTIKIQEVSAPGCAHCAEAKKILEGEIKSQFPRTINLKMTKRLAGLLY